MTKKITFFLIPTLIFSFNIVFAQETQEDIRIIISTDKILYLPEEYIIISGEVTQRTMPVIALRVFDPDNRILGGYNVELDEDNRFSKTVPANIPFYEKPGIYRISAEYGDIDTEIIFEIENELFEIDDVSEVEEQIVIPQILLFETDKQVYQDNDIISITGKVSSISQPQVTITIFDPFGAPTGIYLANVNPDMTFSASFLAKYKTNFKVEGPYSITAQYGGPETRHALTIEFVDIIYLPTDKETAVTDSFLFSESDLQELATWYYLNGSDSGLASFFDELLQRNIIDHDSVSKNMLVGWIGDNRSSIGSMIDDLFAGKISEAMFVSSIEDLLNSYTKQTSSKSVYKISSNTESQKTSSSTDKPEVNELKSKDRDPIIEPDLSGELEPTIVHYSSTVNCNKNIFEDSILQYNNPGPALARLCKYEDAISYYDQTLEDDPENVHALNNKGSALASLGNYKAAILYYDKVLDIEPQYIAALNNKGNALASLGNYEEATSYYDRALGIDPRYVVALENKEASAVLALTVPEEPEVRLASYENPESKVLTIGKENDKDIITQFTSALSSIGTAFLGLFR